MIRKSKCVGMNEKWHFSFYVSNGVIITLSSIDLPVWMPNNSDWIISIERISIFRSFIVQCYYANRISFSLTLFSILDWYITSRFCLNSQSTFCNFFVYFRFSKRNQIVWWGKFVTFHPDKETERKLWNM